jgi:cryptochrome
MASGIEVLTPVSHTLFDPAEILQKVLTNHPTGQFLTTCASTSVSSLLNFRFGVLENGSRSPLAYQSFVSIAGEPPEPVMQEYSELPPVGDTGEYELLPVPTVEDLGYGDISQVRATPHFLKELYLSCCSSGSSYYRIAICRRRFHHSEEVRQKL